MEPKQKIIIITGPTATGKSALAVEIARQFNGEIISADSRQVYRGLDIGSAKITSEEMQDIPHHLIDVADPSEIFTVAEFQKQAREKMLRIFSRGKVPIIVGGTGMYISALVDNQTFPDVPPDPTFRATLEKYSDQQLFEILQEKDPDRAETIDQSNRIRLVRALEIAHHLGTIPKQEHSSEWDTLFIGLTLPKEELKHRIAARINDRIPALFEEIKKLLDQGITSERLNSFGLEYRYGTEYVQGKTTLDEFKEILATKTWQFVRRQMTWWRRDTRVVWMNPTTDHEKIIELVKSFL